MNTAVIVVCGVVWVAVIALQAAEIREQRQTIERLVQKCCDLPKEVPQGAKTRVVSPYIEKTEDET
jgi:hypothetical protein